MNKKTACMYVFVIFLSVLFFSVSATLFTTNSTIHAESSGCKDTDKLRSGAGGTYPESDPTKISNCSYVSSLYSSKSFHESCDTNGDCSCIENEGDNKAETMHFCANGKGYHATLNIDDDDDDPIESDDPNQSPDITKNESATEDTYITATASGYLVVFCDGAKINFSITANGQVYGDDTDETKVCPGADTPVETPIWVNKGDKVIFKLGENDPNAGVGWRRHQLVENDKSDFFKTVEGISTSNNYTLISLQEWSDKATKFIWDTYDFNDLNAVIAVKNPLPVCSSASVGISASNSYLGRTGTFNVNISDLTNKKFYYKYIGNIFTPSIKLTTSLNGSPCNPSNITSSCFIQDRSGYNSSKSFITEASWTHQYKICSDSDLRFCSLETCQAKASFVINPYPGFMNTINGGDAYVKKTVTQNAFPAYSNRIFFTSQLFSTSATNIYFYNPFINISGASKLINYNDINNNNSYFTDLRTKLIKDQRVNRISVNNFRLNNYYMSTLSNTSLNLIDVTGDLNVGTSGDTRAIYCYKPTIFLVSGNLIFNQLFQIPNRADSACMFIVANDTKFNISQNPARIDTYIISKTLSSTLSMNNIPGTLTIKGGVSLQGNVQSITLGKNVNATVTNANGIQYLTPSEQIKYEGARYIKLFGEYLQEPTEIDIREIQYTQN